MYYLYDCCPGVLDSNKEIKDGHLSTPTAAWSVILGQFKTVAPFKIAPVTVEDGPVMTRTNLTALCVSRHWVLLASMYQRRQKAVDVVTVKLSRLLRGWSREGW